jgi:hypothetical protein
MEFHLVADDENAIVDAIDVGAQQPSFDFGFQFGRSGLNWVFLEGLTHRKLDRV